MKTAVITGATGAIGTAIARQMAEKDYRVIAVARNETKAKEVVSQIRNATGNREVDYLLIDLSSEQSIREAAENWQGPVHVLINNAAVTPRSREENSEGTEMQFAVNVLGYFRMIRYFLPYLKEGAPARIVNVASYWAGGLDLDDPENRQGRYNNDHVYRTTKQADRMLSAAFAQRLQSDNITVNAAHPGDVNSKLSNNLGYGGHESPDEGADTPVWAATAPELEGITGKYFEHRRQSDCAYCHDEKQVERLYEICEGYSR
ncbi:MAG: SDR family NAD(P)-dependent oxidoreductase [Bacteroidales bacterium]